MKIHHTNRTMNATFNLKRFLLLEQYKRNETGRHLLWSAAVVSFICILCILYDINRGGSYYGKQTSATEFSRYVLWFILIAPCLLETNFSKRSSTLDILLPASAFEKFLHIWIKYLLLLPLFCSLPDSLPQRSAVLKRQRVPAVFCNAHHDVPDTQHPDTDLCNPACFRLHRLLRLQPASPAEKLYHLCRLHCRLHRNCNFCGLPHARSQSGRILDG